MPHGSKIFAAAAAALVLSTPAFAQSHQHEAAQCPHHKNSETAVSQALSLLDRAKTQEGDQAKFAMEQARQQLVEAQKHMAACEEMCAAQGSHAGHGAQAGHGGHAGHAGHGTAAAAGQAKKELVADPVCGMKIDPKTAAAKSVYAGKTYHFCTAAEKTKFDADPEKYLKKG